MWSLWQFFPQCSCFLLLILFYIDIFYDMFSTDYPFPFHSGGLGVEAVLARRCATVRNRRQPFAGDRVRAVWPCLWRVLQKVVTFGAFQCRVASFCVAGVALRDIQSKVVLCGRRNTFATVWSCINLPHLTRSPCGRTRAHRASWSPWSSLQSEPENEEGTAPKGPTGQKRKSSYWFVDIQIFQASCDFPFNFRIRGTWTNENKEIEPLGVKQIMCRSKWSHLK